MHFSMLDIDYLMQIIALKRLEFREHVPLLT